MHKTILAFVLVLGMPAMASAQSLGCFVDFGNPGACYQGQIPCQSSFAADSILFGDPVAEICEFYRIADDAFDQAIAGWNKCNADHAFTVGQWKACGDTNKQINGAIGYWEGLTHYYEGYTARLKAKCGKKCKGLN